ncbi:MAG: hypothetical protein SO150_10450 [Faecalicoccus sp.]|uniref:hypothetical protein n=1 Tax=unclassified Faecalicoccus TaxID=2643311 RepID=UPI002A7FB9C0|nr:hypothetical protein [Faecalicoccus sp.]MCI6380009.1 hypothetical protein [Erysipelotrichaceae bacterium]MDY4870752.1 hypothetical protein [Faecalicoccus sp.]
MEDKKELKEIVQESKRLYDEQCKKILSYKQILSYLFQSCLEEYKDLSLEEIQDLLDEGQSLDKMISKNVEDQSIRGSMIRYDLLYKLKNPQNSNSMWIDIEPQGMDPGTYDLFHRGFYYATRMVARQRNDPEGFKEDDFDNIQKIITFWICLRHARYKDNTINRYRIEERNIVVHLKHAKEFYDLMEIILLYPRKQQRSQEHGRDPEQ